MRLAFQSVGAVLFSIAGWGCAAKPYQATFNSPLLQPRDTPEITKNGVTVAVDPITRENLMQFPDVVRIATWRQPDPAAIHLLALPPNSGPQDSQLQQVDRSGAVAFVPLPAFRVRIANGSRQPIAFAPNQIQLEDNLHRQYPPILDTMTLKGHFVREMNSTNMYIANDASLMRVLVNQIERLPVLNPTVVVPPGGNWSGYAAFETGAVGPNEYNALMQSVQSLVLHLGGSAGPPSNPGPEFAFNVDKVNKLVTLVCPADAKTPSLEKCAKNETVPTTGSALTRPEGPR